MSDYSSQQDSPDSLKCDICQMVFTNAQDKEQHIKLEHTKEQDPSGVQ